jgi:DNA excision repair protein ERCC-2
LAKEAIPGVIRKADSFVDYLRKFISFMKGLISIKEVKIMSPSTFLDEMNKIIHIEAKVLQFQSTKFFLHV